MKTNTINTAIIAMAIIITGYFLANGYRNRNKPINRIEVTGLSEQNFSSDLAVWNSSFSKRGMDMQEAFKQLKADVEKVKSFMLDKGIKENEMIFSSVQISRDYKTSYDDNGNSTSVFSGYVLTQSIKVESKNLDLVETVSREISQLINEGVEIYSEAPLFYFTKLADLKVKLIEEATKDARLRAEKIAINSDASLGRLLNGDMGIFQITARYADEDYSWGGTLNTTSRDKTASVTVHLEFEVR